MVMAKKIRRARLSAAQSFIPEGTPAAEAAAAPVASPSRQINFGEEYRYIISDLQRIGILAAVILSGLVILSFFIK
jgi:hypothetical protein